MSRGPMPGVTTGAGFKAPPVEAPDPPAWLCEEGRAEWERIVPHLLYMEMLARIDRASLSAYCQAWAELVRCTAILEAEQRFLKEPIQNAKGEIVGEKLKAHPALAAQRDAFTRVKAYLAEFGLTPAARVRLRVLRDGGTNVLASILNRHSADDD